jgi:hypothetical protein
MARHGVTTVETEGVAQAPLFALLPRVDVHVTACSSVVIDAAAFGVPSVVTDPAALSLYPAERDAGLVAHSSFADVVSTAGRPAADGRRGVPVVEDGGMAWAASLLDHHEPVR